jgi:hypothetical protein
MNQVYKQLIYNKLNHDGCIHHASGKDFIQNILESFIQIAKLLPKFSQLVRIHLFDNDPVLLFGL